MHLYELQLPGVFGHLNYIFQSSGSSLKSVLVVLLSRSLTPFSLMVPVLYTIYVAAAAAANVAVHKVFLISFDVLIISFDS